MTRLFAAMLLLSLSAPVRADCKTVAASEFSRLSQGRKRVVFFASWCKSCEGHLTADYAKDSVFVASFDDEQLADAVLGKFLGDKAGTTPCIVDRDQRLSKLYKLKYLPFVAPL